MNLVQYYLKENFCYQYYLNKSAVKPAGIVVHSTGANNPNLKRYVGPDDGKLGKNANGNHWNKYKPGGQSICAHAFIGLLANGSIATYQTLPWNKPCWLSGSGTLATAKKNGFTGNNANFLGYLQFEICEAALTDKTYFEKAYKEAVELCAYLCKTFGIPVNNKALICHSEGNKLGIASNHADVMHWFPKHGKSMDTLRADVAKLLAQSEQNPPPSAQDPPAVTKALYYVRKSWADSKSQIGAFAVLNNAKSTANANKGYRVYDHFGKVVYDPAPAETQEIKKGARITLKNVPLYASSTATKKAGTKSGTYYIWSADVIKGRIRITNLSSRVGVSGQVTGWVNLADIGYK